MSSISPFGKERFTPNPYYPEQEPPDGKGCGQSSNSNITSGPKPPIQNFENAGPPVKVKTQKEEIQDKLFKYYGRIKHSKLSPLKLIVVDIVDSIRIISKLSKKEDCSVLLVSFIYKFLKLEKGKESCKKFADFLKNDIFPEIDKLKPTPKQIQTKIECREKVELLYKCLCHQEELFPLLLSPVCLTKEGNELPDKENLAVMRKAARVLIFGIDLKQSDVQKASKIKSKLQELRYKISDLISSSAVASSLKLLSEQNEGCAYTPERHLKYCEAVKKIAKSGRDILKCYHELEEKLTKSDENPITLLYFNTLIKAPFDILYETSIEICIRAEEAFKVGEKAILGLKSLVPVKKQLDSYFIRNIDELHSYMVQQVRSLFDYMTTLEGKKALEDLLGCISGFHSLFIQFAEASFPFFDSAQTAHFKHAICAGIEDILKSELVFIRTNLKEKEGIKHLEKLEQGLNALSNSLLNVGKKQEQVSPFSYYPLQAFIAERRGENQKLKGTLLTYLNKQLDLTKDIDISITLENFDRINNGLQNVIRNAFEIKEPASTSNATGTTLEFLWQYLVDTLSFLKEIFISLYELLSFYINRLFNRDIEVKKIPVTREEKAVLDYLCHVYDKNLSVFKDAIEFFKSVESFKDEKDVLCFAKNLLSFEERYITIKEISSYYPDVYREIRKIFSLIYPSKDISSNYNDLCCALDNNFISPHQALLQWAKEKILFPETIRSSGKKRKKGGFPSSQSQDSKSLFLSNKEEDTPPSSSTAVLEPSFLRKEEKKPRTDPHAPSQLKTIEKPIFADLPSNREGFLLLFERDLGILNLHPAIQGHDQLSNLRREQINDSKQLLMHAYLPMIREQVIGGVKERAPYLYLETLLLNGALAVEAALKFCIASRYPSKLTSLRHSHDLEALSEAAKLELSFKETNLLRHVSKVIYATSRRPWEQEDFIANILKNKWIKRGEDVLSDLLSFTIKVLGLQSGNATVNLDEVRIPKLDSPFEPNTYREFLSRLEFLEKSIERLGFIHSASRWGRVCTGRTDNSNNVIREKQILIFVKNAPYHLTGIREGIKELHHSGVSCSGISFLFEKITLLLEQNLLAIIAYLDIPSEKDPTKHILLEKIGPEERERPRYFDHNVERALNILATYEDRLEINKNEQGVVHKLRSFLSLEARYLTPEAAGGFTKEMLQLRDLFEDLSNFNSGGFYTEKQTKVFASRYGKNKEEWPDQWKGKLSVHVESSFIPLLDSALSLIEKLMHFSHDLRRG